MFHSAADAKPPQFVDTPEHDREREHDEECFGQRSRHTKDITKRAQPGRVKTG
jgi:hypothetical protein